MARAGFQKLFGVGPIGAIVSLVLLGVAIRVDRWLGHPEILRYPSAMKTLAVLLICAGLALHFWTMYALRNWWVRDRLCTRGPFRWFRHPMYSAWITFVSLGFAFYSDSWVILVWVALLHPIWHLLCAREERVMVDHFHEEYRAYAGRTGRFVPRLRRIGSPR